MTLRAISDKLSAGNVVEVVNDVEVKPAPVLLETGNQFKQAVFIIRHVCDAVVKISSLSQTQTQSTLRICCICLETMIRDKAGDVIAVDQKLTASLFHIARVIGKVDIESFIELIRSSLPVFECMPNAEDPKQINTLAQLSILASNYFVKLEEQMAQSNHAGINSHLLEYWEMMLQVSNLSRKDLLIVFNMAQKIILCFSEKVRAAKQIEELADKINLSLKNFVLDDAKNKQEVVDLNKLFYYSLKAAVRTFRSFTARDEYKLAFKVWKDMIGTLKVALPTSSIEYKALCVIDDCLSPLLFWPKTIPLSKIPFKELKETLVSLVKASAESTGGSKALEQAAFVISSVLSLLISYWSKNFEKVELVIPPSLLSNFEEFFTELVMILRRSCCFLCANTSRQCASEGDVFYAFQLELALLFLCAWVIKWDTESHPLLLKVCENSFGQCQELLTMGRERDCLKSIDFSNHLCDRVYAVAIQNKDNPQICKRILQRGRDWYIQFNEVRKSTLAHQSTARKIMKVLALMHRDLNETSSWSESLAVAVILECLSPDQSEDMFKLWSEVVATIPNEYVPLVTFVKTNKTVKDFLGDLNESSYDYARLFVWETKAFGCSRPQNFSVLLKCWKTRKGLNLSPLQKIQSAALFLSSISFCEDLEMVQEFISSFNAKEYRELLKIISSKDHPVALCALAELFYCRFFIDKKLHQASSKKRVEEAKTFKPLPKVVLSTTDVVDKDDVCNLTPTFEGLSVSKEASLLSTLDLALRHWDDSLKSGLDASLLNNRELLKHADFLVVTALTFRLSGHFLKEKYAWEICRSFGQQVRNDQLVLRAVSGLIDLSCCDAGWIQRSQSIAATLANEPSAQDVLHIYKNSYIEFCFLNGKEEEGAAVLKEVLKSEDKWAWFHIKSMFLYARILFGTPLSLRTSLFPEEHDDMFTIARNCYSKILLLIESVGTVGERISWSNITEHTSVADMLFSISLWLGYTYLEMMLPREARCYLKLHLLVTQKMGLAVRTAECLSLLGKVDMLVQKIEDGLVKVEGLKQILEVEYSEKEDMGDEIPVYRDEEDMDRLRLAPKIGNQTGASPVLPVARFPMPDFASHKTSCSCYRCCHVLLHTLYLDMGYIEAAALSSQCQFRQARNSFCDAMRLADIFRKKHEKLLNGCYNGSAMLDDFIRSETTLRLRYGDLLILEGKDDERTVNQAWDINERLSTFLAEAQSKDTLLLTDVGEQKISLIDIRNQQIVAKVPKQTSVKVCTTAADVTPNISKRTDFGFLKTPIPSNIPGEKARTPLEQITPLNLIPVKEKAFIHGRGVLPLAFHLSDSDDEVESEKGAAKAEGKEDKRKEPRNKTKISERSKGPKETKTNLKVSGRSTRTKETRTNVKSASTAGSSAVEVSIDSDTVIPDSEDDCKVPRPMVAARLHRSRTSKRVVETQGEVKNTDDDSDHDVKVSSRKVKATRSKLEPTDAEKAKSRKTATALEKCAGSSTTTKSRSRRLL